MPPDTSSTGKPSSTAPSSSNPLSSPDPRCGSSEPKPPLAGHPTCVVSDPARAGLLSLWFTGWSGDRVADCQTKPKVSDPQTPRRWYRPDQPLFPFLRARLTDDRSTQEVARRTTSDKHFHRDASRQTQGEGTMRQISVQGLRPNRVRAVFDDDVVFFTLPQGATLAQLADCLGELGRQHIGSPVSLQVEFGSLPAPRPTQISISDRLW